MNSKVVESLSSVFMKLTNLMYVHHQLATKCQAPHEIIDQYFRLLHKLAKIVSSNQFYNTNITIA